MATVYIIIISGVKVRVGPGIGTHVGGQSAALAVCVTPLYII